MSESTTRKITPHHLEREACLYVRQSSLRQVAENTESARRQYGLSRKAMALGWPAECIRVIDDDQGKSGAYSANRSGFRDLMARIGAGEVGIVLGLEVSRLARDNADWHQLLRIAGITDTLILDETGIYDPNDSNDRLLLGFKGTMSEFELQGIKARLLGGQRSAAAHGALKMLLPIGLAYNDRDEVEFDPDRSIVDAIRLVFDSFRRKRSAMAVVKWMHRENVAVPTRPRRGPSRGELRWALPSFAQVGRILRNPRYAGAFVYGRTRVERRADGTERCRVVPMEEWQVCIPDAHVGFIDWDEYLRNQATMASNAAAFLPSGSRTAAPREGAALLQSRVICGHCGRRMALLYNYPRPSRNEAARYFYICKEQLVRYGRKTCQSMRGDLVDAEISRFVIDVINRENIDLALAVQEQVGAEFAEADVGQDRDEDLHILLAAAGAQRQRLAREVGQTVEPRCIVEAHLRRPGAVLHPCLEPHAELAVAVGRAAPRQRLVAVLDPELAPGQPGAAALAGRLEGSDDRIPIGLHMPAVPHRRRIEPRAQSVIVEIGRQRPGQPRRRCPVENMGDRARAYAGRGRDLRPRQAEVVTLAKNILDVDHAGPLHRAPASSLRSIDR